MCIRDRDSVSFLPTLIEDPIKQSKHRYLYWEFYERTFRQAVVMEEWKLIRSDMDDSKIELYDLSKDIGEKNDISTKYPEIVSKMETAMKDSHRGNPIFPFIE